MENTLKEVSLSLRIPADKKYLENALMTLDGVCEHCGAGGEISVNARTKLETAFHAALNCCEDTNEIIDLNFYVENDILNVKLSGDNFNEKIQEKLR